jgi:hypothetical protein
MKKAIKYVAPWLSMAAIGGAIALAPLASAAPAPVPPNDVVTNPVQSTSAQSGEDPRVPFGPDPYVPFPEGFYNPNTSDGSGTTNPAGGVDLPS